ncbi:MAG: hypothetical protein KKF89_06445 [Nanoarchaeota archaeon]|nr:hypothetical protein [Nanoarchaeota archaeon]MBU1855338.1 hypothetical protein [Nanoarchaeota archaeon]
MDSSKDRVKGPTIFFLSIFMLYLIAKVVDYLFLSTYKLDVSHNVLAVILGIIMIIPTIIFMIYFIKNKIQAKLWLHISAGIYLLSNLISLIQVTLFPSGNQVGTGGTKIGPLPVQIFYILLVVFYWFMLHSYFKKFEQKYQ